jgi:RND family efflux transporter MFP subunit
MNITRSVLWCFVIIVACLTVPASAWSEDGIKAITMPSADVTLSFIQPGLIAEVRVREGDMVKAGQIIILQDYAADQARLLLLKEQSEDTTQIKVQEATLAQKTVYLEKLVWAAERGSATELEVEDAKLGVKIAEFSLKSARFEHEQNKRKYEEAKIRVENMRLKSPITGRVEEIEIEVGESINSLDNAVRIVRTDPLWIDVHVPLDKGRNIRLDQTAHINFPGSEQETLEGKVIFISTVADAASSTLKARIEVPNTSNRPSGEQISVLFSTL